MTGQEYPTREQIAEGMRTADSMDGTAEDYLRMADVVLALFPQPTPSEVEVEGSFFAVADLPDILARHMRALDDANRREKQHWIDQHEQPTPSAEPTYHVLCLDGCGVYSYRGQPLDWASREAGRHMRDYDGHRANVVVEQDRPAEPVSIADMAPGTTFTANLSAHRFLYQGEGTYRDEWTRAHVSAAAFDPSTIRDVTPPPTAPETTT